MPSHASASAGPLALTLGDPAGIGPDIALVAWRERLTREIPPFFVLGDPSVLIARARALGTAVAVEPIQSACAAHTVFREALPVLPMILAAPVDAGQPSPAAAASIIEWIEAAVRLLHKGAAAALVTNPIGKSLLYRAGFDHPGHTEFLAELSRPWGVNPSPVMMLACEGLRVVPATVHIPLKEVPASLSKTLIQRTARVVAHALRADFGINEPRLAVAGLNPHAGEDGALGREEYDIVAPALEELRAEGIDVTGPHSADTLFSTQARATYDAAIAMYHDQALIPIKALAFDRAVNVTLGLPFVRTSPDHGTAYKLAGTGRADASSLIAALEMAAAIAERRRMGT